MVAREQLERELEHLNSELRHVNDEQRRIQLVEAIKQVAVRLFPATEFAGGCADRP